MVGLAMGQRWLVKVAFRILKTRSEQWRIPAHSEGRRATPRHRKSALFATEFRSVVRIRSGYNSLRPDYRSERYAGETLRGA